MILGRSVASVPRDGFDGGIHLEGELRGRVERVEDGGGLHRDTERVVRTTFGPVPEGQVLQFPTQLEDGVPAG